MTRIIQHSLKVLMTVSLISISGVLQAQAWKKDKKVNLVFGLTQPVLVDGFNIEGNYIHNRFIFDYSHGVSLDFTENALPTDLSEQGIEVHIPWTTGFGAGYRLTEWLNLRVEPKWHRFEFYYAGENQIPANEITSYNTFTLGLGLYGNFQPFKNHPSFLKGIMIAPSIRFWPTVSSSLDGDSFTYENKITESPETIEVLDPGFGFTPVIFNISVGYTWDLKGKK